MAGHPPGLKTTFRRACGKERSESEDSGEEIEFYSNETRSSPFGRETSSGGHRRIHTHVRVRDNVERLEEHEQGLSEEHQQNGQGVVGCTFFDTGSLPTG